MYIIYLFIFFFPPNHLCTNKPPVPYSSAQGKTAHLAHNNLTHLNGVSRLCNK